ncbi:MAG TPA: NAD-dependent succinate-semialdehyde dehydrogenase [Limnochordia bacterium]|nr:NAD-dependent succinate-semialdehyde dehydrogenase [Limnochordia bacterium]
MIAAVDPVQNPSSLLAQSELFIGGRWRPAEGEQRYGVENPATGESVGSIADASPADAIRAVDAAHAAFPGWAARLPKERSAALRKLYELMLANQDELARILTSEQGKPLAEAKGEIVYAAGFLEWFAEEAKRIYGEIVPPTKPGRRHLILKQPVGVAAAITPWNFPAAMITRKIAPALAAGCTVLIKPAKQTPLTAVAIVKLAEEAGFPPGVINLVTSSRSSAVAGAWFDDPRVKKIGFTGSTEVGKELMAAAAKQVKRISLELGGHAPVLIFDDCDLDAAVAGTIASKYRNMGQTCICANRIYVQRRIYDAFSERLTAAVQALKVGDGLADGVQVGPLIDQAGYEKVVEHVADAQGHGAKLLTGGHRATGGALDRGYFYVPTILTDVREGMLIMEEETFGPVAPLIPFDTEEEALQRANDTRYGLAAYAFTRDLGRAFRIGEGLEYGIVGVNDPVPSTPECPFGGVKESGLGREGGHQGIDEFVQVKYLSLGVG